MSKLLANSEIHYLHPLKPNLAVVTIKARPEEEVSYQTMSNYVHDLHVIFMYYYKLPK